MPPRFTRWIERPGVQRAAGIVLGLLLVVASLSKLGDLRLFAQQVHNFRLAPISAENLLAMTIPWIELIAGLALVLDVRARAGAVVAGGLLLVFTAAVAIALIRGLDIQCGCFGKIGAKRVGLAKLGENLALLALAWIAVGRDRES